MGALELGGSHPRGRSALERVGPQPRGRSALERGRPRPRGGGWANCLGGPRGPPGLQLCRACFGFAGLYAFAFFMKENGFSLVFLVEPYGYPRQ
jgi:hypothetical protein